MNYKLELLKLQEIRQLLEQASNKAKELNAPNKMGLVHYINVVIEDVRSNEVAVNDLHNERS